MLDFFQYYLPQGLANLRRWFPYIWRDRDWDWVYMAKMLERKLTWMAEHEEKYGHHTTSLSDARQMRVCAAILQRFLNDNFWHYENAMKRFGSETTQAATFSVQHERADMMYFGHMLGKNLRNWWD